MQKRNVNQTNPVRALLLQTRPPLHYLYWPTGHLRIKLRCVAHFGVQSCSGRQRYLEIVPKLLLVSELKMPQICFSSKSNGNSTHHRRNRVDRKGTEQNAHRKNHSVVILTRKIPAIQPVVNGISYALWNVEAGSIDSTAIASADYIIHLAGAGVADKRWTAKEKEIVESRTKAGN